MLALAFAVVFGAGPAIFAALTVVQPVPRQAMMLVGITAACIAGAMGLRAVFGETGAATGVALTLIWLAWIAVMALGAQALRRLDSRRGMIRLTRVGGAIATTVPWFGFAAAHMVTG
ncbi:hypothetical protein [Sulfitobacter sabulilitoris]|uniref:Uncharacterized protein n=1 Tax=Sulfitobacter sabulilitoris TaxID=2562655 RepID=A0A5S3PKM7_9RHOB|nr:hypothetical protein [Sulfitobacter sabulilitoris]TMM52756.1 hypothetical protein FDT80_10880 [Sulfitobacter sabulilitoris]